jgi:DNA-binding XRE family transcriptional regulator
MLDEPRLKKYLGNRIKGLRVSNGYKQVDLATLVGLERTSITNIESGKQMVSVPLIYKLCHIFQVDVSDLMPKIEDILIHKVTANQQANTVVIGGKTMAAINRVRGG